jgi:hypothetical protein
LSEGYCHWPWHWLHLKLLLSSLCLCVLFFKDRNHDLEISPCSWHLVQCCLQNKVSENFG